MNVRERRQGLRDRIVRNGCDAVVLSYGSNLRYYTGWDPHPGERPLFLIVGRGGDALVVPRLHAADAERLDVDHRVVYADGESAGAALGGLTATWVGESPRLLVEDAMRADFAVLAQEALGADRVRLAHGLPDAERARKAPDELELLRGVARLTDRALERVLAGLRPGITELETAEQVHRALFEEGADATAFALVGFGPNSAEAHVQPGRRRLSVGDALLVDIGARKDGYVSDITRVGFVGQPPRAYVELYELVRRALDAALSAVRPGALARDVDRAARAVIQSAGYGQAFRHRVGHGIGLSVHEPPFLTSESTQRLEPGMVITIEPGVYLMGRYGIRLEQAVIVTEAGFELLPRASLAVRRVPAA